MQATCFRKVHLPFHGRLVAQLKAWKPLEAPKKKVKIRSVIGHI